MDLVISSAVSGVFYYAYKYSMGKIGAVLSAKPLEFAQPGDYIKVEGKVTLLHNAKLESHFASGKVLSVMHEITKNHLISKWDRLFLRWVSETDTISRTFRSVPFQLTTSLFPNTPLVNIGEMRPEDIANELPLLTLTTKFSPTSPSQFVDTTVNSQNVKSLGFQTIERALPVGTSLTVVGELSQPVGDDLSEGVLEVIKPRNLKLPFVATRETYGVFIHRQTAVARLLWWVFLGSVSVFGVCIIRRLLPFVYPRFKMWHERRRLQHYLTERKRHDQSLGNIDIDTDLCLICFAKPRNVIILECGHKYTCSECTEKLLDCPLCKGPMRKGIQVDS
ncbi:hypothetical protein K7432_003100 [Basidiobolus ranarum]|uniref:RING-type E3 ubiquitin transferase n=1 Tax=Basidiobolus ranarum TaxID=34480 RepID=A0ABR2W6Q8_9FUNG